MSLPRIAFRIDHISAPFDAGKKREVKLTISLHLGDAEITSHLRQLIASDALPDFSSGDTYDAVFVKRVTV